MPITQVPNRMLAFNEGPFGFKNKIINGDMRVCQRNTYGNPRTVNTNGVRSFVADRFFSYFEHNSSALTVQSSRLLTDGVFSNGEFFPYYLRTQVTGASNFLNTGINEQFGIQHRVEGLNMVDFGFGTPVAKPITLSFWVRSSHTGRYFFTFISGNYGIPPASGRVYPTTYQINTANTWEKKTITIPGDVVVFNPFRWYYNNDIGIVLSWYLGGSSNHWVSGGLPLNQWSTQSAWYDSTILAGGIQVLNNKPNGYIDITGVQLEVGSTVTPFEVRSFVTEENLCKRYFQQNPYFGYSGAKNTSICDCIVYEQSSAANYYLWNVNTLPVTMRTDPTFDVHDMVGNFNRFSRFWSQAGASDNNWVPYYKFASTQYYQIAKYTEAGFGFACVTRFDAEL